jgi:hypothetical protein
MRILEQAARAPNSSVTLKRLGNVCGEKSKEVMRVCMSVCVCVRVCVCMCVCWHILEQAARAPSSSVILKRWGNVCGEKSKEEIRVCMCVCVCWHILEQAARDPSSSVTLTLIQEVKGRNFKAVC